MYISELNLAVDELIGLFERNTRLLHIRSDKISNWTCGQHISHVLKMNMCIIDEIILLAYDKESEYHRNKQETGKIGLFLRSLMLSNDENENHCEFDPDPTFVINGNWFSKIVQEWDTKVHILDDADLSWKKKVLPTPDHVMGHMTGENWIRYLTTHTYHHISLINKILSKKNSHDGILMDFPTDNDFLLQLKSFSVN